MNQCLVKHNRQSPCKHHRSAQAQRKGTLITPFSPVSWYITCLKSSTREVCFCLISSITWIPMEKQLLVVSSTKSNSNIFCGIAYQLDAVSRGKAAFAMLEQEGTMNTVYRTFRLSIYLSSVWMISRATWSSYAWSIKLLIKQKERKHTPFNTMTQSK